MSTAVFARLFLYFSFILLLFSRSKEEVEFLATCCSRRCARPRILITDFLSVRLSGSKLSFSSFSQVFTAADLQIRPHEWKRVTNLLLITTHITHLY